jgi:hypothetical protein
VSALTDELLDDQHDEDVRAALSRALRELDKVKRSKAEYVEAVYRAAHDAALSLDFPAVPFAPKDRRKAEPEVAISVLSDWQLAKITPSYNSEVCEQRIEQLADKVERLVAIQRADHPVREARLWLLGDLVEGEMIFPGQVHSIDASVYNQALITGPRILGNYIRRMAGIFEKLHVVAVIGNHGRNGRKGEFDPETNWDRVLYRHTANVLDGRAGMEHVTWTIPEGKGESHWYAVDRVGRYGSLLFHGYNLKGQGGMPWYGLQKKVGGWALGAVEEFALASESQLDVDFGHWHQPTRVTLNRVTARCNGSTESHDTYAMEQLAAVGRPSQGLRFVHPDKGIVTAEYTVYLD